MTKKLLLLTCAMGVLAGVSTAGSASAQATSTGASATEVGAVIVTAEKRQANIQKVPIAVTAFTAKERDTIGIETLQDMTNFAPGLTYTSTTDHLYVRGVGRQSINLAADAGVASYTDGFYNPDPVLIVLPPMFIGNTEVLRGPQGTLQGRNGIAGALLVDSKRPTSTPYAEGRVTVGNYGLNNYELAVSGPLADGLNFRLAGFDENQNQGYFKNVAGGPTEGGLIHTWYVEGMVTAKLGDNTDFFAKAFTFGNNSRGGPGARAGWNANPYQTSLDDYSSPLAFNAAAAYGVSCNSALTCGTLLASGVNPVLAGSVVQTNNAITGNPAVGNHYNFSGNFPTYVGNHDDGDINYVVTHHFPGMDLKYTGGYQQYTYQTIQSSESFTQQTDVISYETPAFLNPSCATPAAVQCLTIFPTQITNYVQSDAWYSHEITLSSTDHGPLQWIGGLYYYHENFSNPIITTMPQQAQVATPLDLLALEGGHVAVDPNPSLALYNTNYHIQDESKAVFGQVDYKITDTIKLTGGVRYTSDRKFGDEEYRLVTFGGSVGSFGASGLDNLVNPAYVGLTGFSTVPAIDLTSLLCATAGMGPGAQSTCKVNPAGIATRRIGGTSSAVTGTAGIEWTPDSTTLGYLRYSRGYKELGLNAGNLTYNALVAPEHMDDFEAGIKKTFGRNLVVDLAVFYENYLDAQFPLGQLNPISGLNQTDFLNIPKARSDGIELETIWTPINHLQLLLSYALDDTAFQTNQKYVDAANPGLGPLSINGDQLPNSPKNKVSFNANYDFVFDFGDLNLSGTYLWRDTQMGSIYNESVWRAPSWSQVDLRATWRGKGDRYEIVAFGRNVFNQTGYPSGPSVYQYGSACTATFAGAPAMLASPCGASNAAHSYPLATYTTNPPAVYGMEFHYKFF